MNLRIEGKTALITAATDGIGFAVATQLARQGADIWINGRSCERLDRAKSSIQSTVPEAVVETIAADVSTSDGIDKVIEAVPDLDILIPMAGGTSNLQPFTKLTDDDWLFQWNLNVMQGVRLARHYVPVLQKKTFGRVVFVASESGIVTPLDVADYGVAKAAVIRLSRCVAETFEGNSNVTANCVVPGATVSPWVHRMAEGRELKEVEAEYFSSPEHYSLSRRFAKAEEVANMVGYLCSPASSATRGAVLRVDSGSIRTS